ncbi:MAG: biopolymer transporter ExbD [Chthoniobacterales bacterium]|jgi:biopolymer transport protein ExbD|nr:biopolymer transporter ExbD [Chthoniobacterales bacterium]
MQVRRRDVQMVEMQMGPMIDVVFLLLVFFMVTAKPVKEESDISLGLPGTVSAEEVVDLPDEQRIRIDDDGSIVLNDSVLGPPGDTVLTGLIATLKRFKESADANKADTLVTLDAADGTNQQRIVDVLNACAKADITGVTFSDSASEEEL